MEFGYRRYFRILFVSQIELRHLRTLVALLETGSLVEASERVFLTQWALSHQIKDLEARLGCSLFLRKTRPVRFTSAGNRLQQLADGVLERLYSAELDLDRFAGGQSGRNIMAIDAYCDEWSSIYPVASTLHPSRRWPEWI